MGERFSGIAAITFDFFRTLVRHRTGRGRGATLMAYLHEQGLASDPWAHRVLYDVFQSHASDYAPDLPPTEKDRYLRDFTERVFRSLNVQAGPDVAAEHAEAIWQLLGPDSLRVFDEVPEVLRSLRARRYRLAVISNWQCGLGHFCAELGIADAFEHVLASAEVGAAKPDPRIFLEACRRLDLPPERVLHVGDDFIEDVEGARSAGLRVAWLRRDDAPTAETESPVIADLSALPALLPDVRS